MLAKVMPWSSGPASLLHAIGGSTVRPSPSNRATQVSYQTEPPQRIWSCSRTTSTSQPSAFAAAVISVSDPISPGRTIWFSSSRNTGTLATLISSSICRPARSRCSFLVNRLIPFSRMRCASSQSTTSSSRG
jgi:hypothetical protein